MGTMSGPEVMDRTAPRPATEAVRAFTRFEPGPPAYSKGLRAGLVLGGALAVGLALDHLTAGVVASLGALNCVMADTQDYPLRRRVPALGLAVAANAVALVLGTAAGAHLWIALLVMAPVTVAAGLAGLVGKWGASIGLTASVIFMVGLGLSSARPALGATFLECLAGGVAAVVVLVARLSPDPLGPADRSVAGALSAVADVYAALATPRDRPGPVTVDLVTGRSRLARQRLAVAGEVLAVSWGRRHAAAGAPERLAALLRLGHRLVAAGEAVAELETLMEADPSLEEALALARRAADELAGALRSAAGALRASRGQVAEPPNAGALETTVARLGHEAERLRREGLRSGEPERARLAVGALAILRPMQETWSGLVRLVASSRDDADSAPAPDVRVGAAAFVERLGRNLTGRSAVLRRSAQFALTAMVGYALASQLGLDKPYWVTLTIAVILQPAAAPSLQRALLRLGGTFAGSVLGALLLASVSERNGLVVAVALLAVAAFALIPLNYGIGVVFLTPLVLVIVSLPHPGDWALALSRIEATCLGAALVIASGLVLWPGAARQRIAAQLRRALVLEARYLEAAVSATLVEPTPDQLDHLDSCREDAALQIDNVQADLDRWVGDLPRRREQLATLWSLTGEVRSLQREISTIAEQAPMVERTLVPAELEPAAAALRADLEQLASSLDGHRPARYDGHRPPARHALLSALSSDVEQLETDRALEVAAGQTEVSTTGRAVRSFGVVRLALLGIDRSMRRIEQDLAVAGRL